jgi:uncharacterized protein YfaS (alpha-2-macroglobulin family)
VETEISAERQKIDLAVTTDQQAYIPGDTATVKIQATDYQGDGAVTEVALWTIDKALYELAQDRTPEIFPEFWELATWNGTTTYHSYTDLMLHGNAAEMGGGCFAADTAITLADGSTKAIQDIVVGDQVLTRSDRDDITAGTQPGRVSAVMAHPNYVGLLTINDFLHVTGEHLIYLNGRFQEAARAQVGDSLSLADGTPLKITSLVWSLKEETVYNFTVAESHTYFADGVWVHNQKGDERSLFKDTAYWNPSIWTNADGQAQVQFVVPDNLTTWVLHAVAMNQQTQVGQTDSEIQVQRDVVVVPIMPDILRVNDEIQLGMLVRNHTATAQTITPGFEFAAGDIIQNPASTITIPALSTQEVWWRVKVTTEAEAADLHFWADGETERQSDNVRVSLPVLPFGKSEKTSTSFTQAGQTTINLPADVRQDKSSLEVVLSPSLMAKVQAGFNYTIGYPYGCVEQTCSGLSALLTAKANSNYFRSLKNYDQIDAYIEAGVAHLFDLRQDDGGWAYWSSRERAASFYTLYVLEQLVRAEALGYTLPTGWRGEATEALLDLIGVGVDTETQAKTFNAFFSDAEVMALYGLLLLDAEELVLFNPSTVTFSNYLDIEALNYAIRLAIDWQNQPLIDDLVRQLLDKTVGETTAQFWPAARTGSSAYQSQDSNTALSLQTLMLLPAASTHQSLIDATIEQLIAGQRRGYWANTYGTSRVSATLFDYVRTRGETAQQTYRVLLDGQLVRQGTFRDVLEVQTVDLPLAQVRPESVLTVETDAESNTLYWTLQQDLWRTATDLPAQTNSAYTLEKIYVDERHQHLGEPQVGDVVTVYLDLNNKTGSGLEEVVITDYLPSGWIALNANLDNFVGSSITSRSSYYAHQAFYPDRIEIAFRRLQPGHNVIAYQARVVTLAQAVLLPTSTEMMYQPEVVVNEPMRPQVVLAAKPSWAADFGWQNIGDDEQPTANTFSIPFISKDGSSDDQAFLIAIIIVGLAGIIIVGLDYARRKYPSRWAKLRQLWSKPTAETSLPETVEMGDEVVDVDEVEDPDEKEVSGVIKPRSQRRDEKHDEKKT